MPIRDLICKRCGIKIGEETTAVTTRPKPTKLCPACRSASIAAQNVKLIVRNQSDRIRKINSSRMRSSNPMLRKEVAQKVSETLKHRYAVGEIHSVMSDSEKLAEIKAKGPITTDGRRRISERMKNNNPMKLPKSLEQRARTFRSRVRQGVIQYKKGNDHHLWKGNRPFSEEVRVRLHPVWTHPIMQRDGFICMRCGAQKGLQVHHLKPLREFLAEVKTKHSIRYWTDLDPTLREPYILEILNAHRLEHGITICKSCHSQEDQHYRAFEKN